VGVEETVRISHQRTFRGQAVGGHCRDEPHLQPVLDRLQNSHRPVNGGIASVSDWKKEKTCGTENQEQHKLKAEMSPEYQSTAPIAETIKRVQHLHKTRARENSFSSLVERVHELRHVPPARHKVNDSNHLRILHHSAFVCLPKTEGSYASSSRVPDNAFRPRCASVTCLDCGGLSIDSSQ
jgi:hypothetical protein